MQKVTIEDIQILNQREDILEIIFNGMYVEKDVICYKYTVYYRDEDGKVEEFLVL